MIVLLGAAGVIVTAMVAVAMILLTPHNLRAPADRRVSERGPATGAPAQRDGLRVGSVR